MIILLAFGRNSDFININLLSANISIQVELYLGYFLNASILIVLLYNIGQVLVVGKLLKNGKICGYYNFDEFNLIYRNELRYKNFKILLNVHIDILYK